MPMVYKFSIHNIILYFSFHSFIFVISTIFQFSQLSIILVFELRVIQNLW